MKTKLRFLPALIIAAAALLCLSFDNTNRISLLSNNIDTPPELFQTTSSPRHKAVLHECPDGINHYITCEAGSSACQVLTCPID